MNRFTFAFGQKLVLLPLLPSEKRKYFEVLSMYVRYFGRKKKCFKTCFLHENNQDGFTVVAQPDHKSPVCYRGHYHDESLA